MTPRVAILCNDRLCLPAVNWLVGAGIAIAVGMPEGSHETQMLIQQQCNNLGRPFNTFKKETLHQDLLAWLQQYKPDVVLVKTFPWRIPAEVLDIPSQGFINFHYAPLPQFRGPNPLFWMIRRQVQMGGVTIHLMDEGFDSGPIIMQQPISLSPDLTYGWLCTQLAYAGLQLTWALLQGLAAGSLQLTPQQGSEARWYPRPSPNDLVVNWNTNTAEEIRALALACNPWNKGAATSWNNWMFGITDASIVQNIPNAHTYTQLPGTVLAIDEQQGLLVSCLNNQVLKLNVIYCEEGFFPGEKMASFGIKPGCRLGPHPIPSLQTEPQPSSALHQSS